MGKQSIKSQIKSNHVYDMKITAEARSLDSSFTKHGFVGGMIEFYAQMTHVKVIF